MYRPRKTLHRVDPRRACILISQASSLSGVPPRNSLKPHRQMPHRGELLPTPSSAHRRWRPAGGSSGHGVDEPPPRSAARSHDRSSVSTVRRRHCARSSCSARTARRHRMKARSCARERGNVPDDCRTRYSDDGASQRTGAGLLDTFGPTPRQQSAEIRRVQGVHAIVEVRQIDATNPTSTRRRRRPRLAGDTPRNCHLQKVPGSHRIALLNSLGGIVTRTCITGDHLSRAGCPDQRFHIRRASVQGREAAFKWLDVTMPRRLFGRQYRERSWLMTFSMRTA